MSKVAKKSKATKPINSALNQLLQELSPEEMQSGLIRAKHSMGKAVTPEQIQQDLQQALVSHSLREALIRARKARAVTLETLAKQQGISKERASQIERAEEKLELQTLLRHVAALNYELSLVLTPKDGKGETVSARLGW